MIRARARLLTVLLAIGACTRPVADAYGNFEATEVTVSAESGGRVERLTVAEGDRVVAGAEVGTIDTTALALQRRELLARRAASQARLGEVAATAAGIAAQRVIAEREAARTQRLLAAQAATVQQSDRAARDVEALRQQGDGARAARETIAREVAAIDAQLATLDDRVRRSRIVVPTGGTVLARYVEAGEFAQPGTPLFKVAPLDTLVLRAYVSGAQLAGLALGQAIAVQVDAGGGGVRTLAGRLTWIAAGAEFTPTPIQTREERTTQVYAVKVAVPNVDGRLRIGMPGEVILARRAAAR